MRPKLNLKVKSQMSKPNEYTDNIKSNLTCTFLSVRTKLKKNILPSDTVYIWEVGAKIHQILNGFFLLKLDL